MNVVISGYSKTFEPVKKMLLDNFNEPDSVIVLGYHHFDFNNWKIRKQFPNKKIIIYQLEQLADKNSTWYNPNSTNRTIIDRTLHVKKALRAADEVWDYDELNVPALKEIGCENIKIVPLMYSESLNKRTDVLFFGALNDRRIRFLNHLAGHKLRIITNSSDIAKYKHSPLAKFMKPTLFGSELQNEINAAKIVVNIHYFDIKIQEQVRLFDLLINNVQVISEVSNKNHFPDLIKEFETPSQMLGMVDEILDKSISSRFKPKAELKPYKVGVAYSSFYGLELIEESINSIKDIVDYIVVVHQEVSFSGEVEPKGNKKILDRLCKNGIEVVYCTPKDMLEKRNIGLEKCKSNGCDYIIPADTDELYNSDELKKEIDRMAQEGIDTLYMPIKTFYHDRGHWFEDDYFVPSVYKINDRVFKRSGSSVLCDPVRKMEERKFRVSPYYMLHYSLLKESYQIKIAASVSSANLSHRTNKDKVYRHLMNWKEGDKALVFRNVTLENKSPLAEVQLYDS